MSRVLACVELRAGVARDALRPSRRSCCYHPVSSQSSVLLTLCASDLPGMSELCAILVISFSIHVPEELGGALALIAFRTLLPLSTPPSRRVVERLPLFALIRLPELDQQRVGRLEHPRARIGFYLAAQAHRKSAIVWWARQAADVNADIFSAEPGPDSVTVELCGCLKRQVDLDHLCALVPSVRAEGRGWLSRTRSRAGGGLGGGGGRRRRGGAGGRSSMLPLRREQLAHSLSA
eukprot:scaffold27812_cov31-Tisochrysis_lutea.AAC.2